MIQTDSIQSQTPVVQATTDTAHTVVAQPVQPVFVRRPAIIYGSHMSHGDSVFFNLADFTRDKIRITDEHIAAELRPSALHTTPADTTYQLALVPQQTTEEYRTVFRYVPRHEPLISHDSGWICAVAFLGLVLVAIARTQSRLLFSTLVSLTLSDYEWRKVMPTLQFQDLWPSRLLYFNFFVVMSLVLFELAEAYDLTSASLLRGPYLYIALFSATIAFFVLKVILQHIFAFIFSWGNFKEHFMRSEAFAMDIMGIYLLPIVFIFAVAPESVYPIAAALAFAVIAVAYLWRLFNTLKIISLDGVSVFYIILYLCAVELMPLLVAYRAMEIVLK